MTLDELKAQCLRSKEMGSSQVLLVIPRKTPPRHDFVSVKGMGKGYVCNAQERNGRWEVVAYFRAETILKTIAKQEALNAAFDEKDPAK